MIGTPSPSDIPHARLNDGREIPLVGLGTYKLTGPETVNTIRRAIECGYRHFDTAFLYSNEVEVGRAVREAIAAGDVAREDLFITSKLWNDDQPRATEAFNESLRRLELDYVDLFMVHWPWPQNGTFVAAYEALLEQREAGRIRSVGVANFYEETLDELIAVTGVAPAVNQVELHAGFTQPELRDYHARHSILTEAWAPLGRGEILDSPQITQVAAAYGATPAQIALAYHVSRGISVIPKTSSAQRLEENFAAASIALDRESLDLLDTIPGGRQSNDPRIFPG
ncbi:aldo/keto reductase [Corynebacterium sp. MSK041]|uniref:aldo/keto reductase n=1 Tax=Corynebacterium sp. MSK041 TaxID=3050194 RepID=UPI00254FF04F|nr:aldo/keto reductase [Corynebacterium sp. MSK041]MDK8796035.1 aldo/keto reductase [Corynebacterium sp. MSK041]